MKKTLIIAACLGLSSVAVAQKGTGGTSAVLEITAGTPATPNGTPTIVSSTYDAAVGSTTLVFDISGTESWDAQLDPSNTVLAAPVPDGGAVTAIGWDVNLSTVGASWLSEAVMDWQGEVFLTVGIGDDGPGTASYASGPPIVLADVGIPDIMVGAGGLPIEFFESFDDADDAVDANFGANSTLTIVYSGGAAGVPTVSQWGLIILTVLLLLGVVVMSVKSKNEAVTA